MDFKRLIYPYIVFACIYVLRFSFFEIINGNWESTRITLISAMWMSGAFHEAPLCGDIPPIGMIWFLPALFWSRTIFNVTFNTNASIGYKYLIIACISVISILIDKYIIALPCAILPGCSASIFLAIGHAAKNNGINSRIVITSLFCWLLSIKLCHLEISRCLYGIYPVSVCGGAGGTIAVCFISKYIKNHINGLASILSWIGRYSLVFLCMHFLVSIICIAGRFNVTNIICYLLIDYTVIIALTWLCTKIPFCIKLFQLQN